MSILTPKEKLTLEAIGKKGSYKDIAHLKLGVKSATVDTYISRIFKKLIEATEIEKTYRPVFKHRMALYKKRISTKK